MQTFLPYSDYRQSALCLDRARLGKQRVECLQLLKACFDPTYSWSKHPCAKMWKGYEASLLSYTNAICDEWTSRGYRDTCKEKANNIFKQYKSMNNGSPIWLGDEDFHNSHKSNLLRKAPDFYKKFNWSLPDDLPYVWPTSPYA